MEDIVSYPPAPIRTDEALPPIDEQKIICLIHAGGMTDVIRESLQAHGFKPEFFAREPTVAMWLKDQLEKSPTFAERLAGLVLIRFVDIEPNAHTGEDRFTAPVNAFATMLRDAGKFDTPFFTLGVRTLSNGTALTSAPDRYRDMRHFRFTYEQLPHLGSIFERILGKQTRQ